MHMAPLAHALVLANTLRLGDCDEGLSTAGDFPPQASSKQRGYQVKFSYPTTACLVFLDHAKDVDRPDEEVVCPPVTYQEH